MSSCNFDRFLTLSPIGIIELKITRQKSCTGFMSKNQEKENINLAIKSLVLKRSKMRKTHFYRKELGLKIFELQSELSTIANSR